MKFSVFLGFVLLASVLLSVPGLAQAQDTVSVELNTATYNKSTLRILIVAQSNQSWWLPYLVDMTQLAVNQWSDGISYFSSNYAAYGYLSNLRLVTEVGDEVQEGYDIYVTFSQNVSFNGNVDTLGLTTTFPLNNGTVKNSTVSIGASSEVVPLTMSDLRDVTVHELGHALGLGHSNSTSDLMFAGYDIYSSRNAISTLDLYGVATLFGWMRPGSEDLAGRRLNVTFVTLPPDVPFGYAAINNPAPSTPYDNVLIKGLEVMSLFLQNNPLIALVIVVAIGLFVVASILTLRTNPRRKAQKLRNRRTYQP